MLSKFTAASIVFIAFTVFTVGVAIYFKNPLLVFTAVFLVVTNIALYIWAQQTVRGLAIKRILPRLAVAERPTEVDVKLTNNQGVPRYGTLGFDLHRELTPGEDYTPVAFLDAPPHQTVSSTYTFIPARRGIFRVGPFYLYGGDPFGFYKCWRKVEDYSELTVLPLPVDFKFVRPVSASRLAQDETETISTPGESTEFMGVREYVQGDSMRRVHWRSTARLGTLISRQYEMNVSASVSTLVMIDKAMQKGSSVHNPLEYSLKMAASLGYATIRERFFLSHLVLMGDEHDFVDGIGSQFYQQLAVHLAHVKNADRINWDEANKLIINYLPTGSSVVLFISHIDDKARDWLRQVAARFRGLSVVTFNLDSFSAEKKPTTASPHLSFGEGYLIIEVGFGDDLSKVLEQLLAKSVVMRGGQ